MTLHKTSKKLQQLFQEWLSSDWERAPAYLSPRPPGMWRWPIETHRAAVEERHPVGSSGTARPCSAATALARLLHSTPVCECIQTREPTLEHFTPLETFTEISFSPFGRRQARTSGATQFLKGGDWLVFTPFHFQPAGIKKKPLMIDRLALELAGNEIRN